MTDRLRKVLLAVAAAGLLAPVTALADPAIGSRVTRGEKGLTGRFNPRQAESPRPAINADFRCTASLDMSRASKLLALAYMSEEQTAAIDDVGPRSSFSDARREDCFSDFGGGGVRFQYDPVSAIGGFAEFFTQRNFTAEDAAKLSSLSREDWRSPNLTPRNGSEMMGLCTAQVAGTQIFHLVETEPASAAESAAIKAIVPFLGPCLTSGVEVSFDAASLRALLAHSLFKALSGLKALEKAKS